MNRCTSDPGLSYRENSHRMKEENIIRWTRAISCEIITLFTCAIREYDIAYDYD